MKNPGNVIDDAMPTRMSSRSIVTNDTTDERPDTRVHDGPPPATS
ncbi:hypothetical protein [Burkholderia sp. Ac-20365]|nr:hypothetical protein [Burkholderia sp. Ac-20365]